MSSPVGLHSSKLHLEKYYTLSIQVDHNLIQHTITQDTSGAPYPVMVHLHGGGYTGSANIQYPGHFQAGYDVVVAVPIYRVGALGITFTAFISRILQ